MTDREKLIKMLVDVPVSYELCMRIKGHCPTTETPCYECLADYLLANGVTFASDTNDGSTWISVEDRLPTCYGYYIVAVKLKYDFEKEYTYDTDVAEFTWEGGYIDDRWNTSNDWCEGQQYLHVTHWMPLPEPPVEV